MNKELEFYKSYHSNIFNKWIHFFCIPMIIISIIIFLNSFYISYENTKIYKIKLSHSIMLIYSISYFGISFEIGFLMSIYFLFLNYISEMIILKKNYLSIANYIFIFGWVFQFIGHYIEGKRPALIDSITQAFYQAPLFSFEILLPELFKFK